MQEVIIYETNFSVLRFHFEQFHHLFKQVMDDIDELDGAFEDVGPKKYFNEPILIKAADEHIKATLEILDELHGEERGDRDSLSYEKLEMPESMKVKRARTFIRARVDIRNDEDIYKLLNCEKFLVTPINASANDKAWIINFDEKNRFTIGDDFYTKILNSPLEIDLVEAEELLQSAGEEFAEFRNQVELCIKSLDDEEIENPEN